MRGLSARCCRPCRRKPSSPACSIFSKPSRLPKEEEEDYFAAEALLQREVPNGVIVSAAVPCPLPRLRGRYRFHVELRAQDRATLRRVARKLQELTPPKGVVVVIDVDPLTLA